MNVARLQTVAALVTRAVQATSMGINPGLAQYVHDAVHANAVGR